MSSSLPTARIAAVRTGASEVAREVVEDRPEQDLSVECRHQIIGHDAAPAVQRFEPVGRPGLDDIEGTKQEKAELSVAAPDPSPIRVTT